MKKRPRIIANRQKLGRRPRTLSQRWLDAVELSDFALNASWHSSSSVSVYPSHQNFAYILRKAFVTISPPELQKYSGVKARLTPTNATVKSGNGENDVMIGIGKDMGSGGGPVPVHVTIGVLHVMNGSTHERYLFIESRDPSTPHPILTPPVQVPLGNYSYDASILYDQSTNTFTCSIVQVGDASKKLELIYSPSTWAGQWPEYVYYGGSTVHSDSRLMNDATITEASYRMRIGSSDVWFNPMLNQTGDPDKVLINTDTTNFDIVDIEQTSLKLKDNRGG